MWLRRSAIRVSSGSPGGDLGGAAGPGHQARRRRGVTDHHEQVHGADATGVGSPLGARTLQRHGDEGAADAGAGSARSSARATRSPRSSCSSTSSSCSPSPSAPRSMAARPDLGGAGPGHSSSSGCCGGRGSGTRGSPASSTPRRAPCDWRSSRPWPRCWWCRCASPRPTATSASPSRSPTGWCGSASSCCSGSPSRDDPTLRHSVWIGLVPSTARRHRAPRRRVAGRRRRAARAVGRRPRPRHARAVPVRVGGLEARAPPLRRAPRPHLHHRPRASRSWPSASAPRRGWTPASSSPPCSASALAAAMWWAYFDVVALVAERRLSGLPGRQGAERDGARLVLAPALPDGRGRGADRPRA